MCKITKIPSIKILGLFVILSIPISVLAAYSDVNLTTSTNIIISGITLNVSGTTASVQSITVNSNNFTVTLASSSSLTISSPGLNQIFSDIQTDVVGTVCSNATSTLSLAYSGAGTVTNIITASTTGSCSTATPGAPSGVSATAGNGQAVISFSSPSVGGSPIISYTVTSNPGNITATGNSSPITITGLTNNTAYTFTVLATNSSGNGPSSSASNQITPVVPIAPTPTPSVSSGSSGGFVSPAALANYLAPGPEKDAYLAKLYGITNPNMTPSGQISFTKNFNVGASDQQILNLQKYLNNNGYKITNFGPGSPGYETNTFGGLTKVALMKFQKDHGLPATGFFGPQTRNVINKTLTNNTPKNNTVTQNITSSSTQPSTQFTQDLNLGDVGQEVKNLQIYLNTHGYIIANSGPGSSGYETNTFGGLTKASLIKFQRDHGLPATGYFGPQTKGVINSK